MKISAYFSRSLKIRELEIAIRKTNVKKDLGRVSSNEKDSSVIFRLAKPKKAFAAVTSYDTFIHARQDISSNIPSILKKFNTFYQTYQRIVSSAKYYYNN
jgi:hypothetical protein